jgi:hypothetical protein
VSFSNVEISAALDGKTIEMQSGISNLHVHGCKLSGGSLVGESTSNVHISQNIFDCPGTYAINASSPAAWSIIGNVFKNGQLLVSGASQTRIVGNHLNDGGYSLDPVLDSEGQTTVLFRANTPNSNNNEVDDFNKLLQYIGSTSVLQGSPIYSNNYAGPAGKTSRLVLERWISCSNGGMRSATST